MKKDADKKGGRLSKGASGPKAVKMLHLTVPLSQPLSIIEALQILQTQLQHAQEIQAKQVRGVAFAMRSHQSLIQFPSGILTVLKSWLAAAPLDSR